MSLVAQHLVCRLILNGTSRTRTTQLGQLDFTPRAPPRRGSGTGARFAPDTDPAGMAWEEWKEWERCQSSTSRAPQVVNRCQTIKGWSKRQLQTSARMKGSCKETLQEAEDQLELQEAEASIFLRTTLFNGSSMVDIQRVLEQHIGMHHVPVGVEGRFEV